jgi:hypothetical protein
VKAAAGIDMAACFIVKAPERSSAGVVYFEDEPWRRAAARLLTKDEARRIAANIASCRRLAAARVAHRFRT